MKKFIAEDRSGYRNEISRRLHDRFYNFDYLLLRDIFINSMEMRNPYVNISVKDLIFIYNSLVEKGENIYIPEHENDEDPL